MRVSIDRISFTAELGVGLPNDFLQLQPERFRWKAGADDHEKVRVRTQGVGIVNRALGCTLGEPRLFHRADDADNGECIGIACLFWTGE